MDGSPSRDSARKEKKILLVNQYFWPDLAATAQLLGDLAEDLAAAGWRVTALCGRGSYTAGRPARYVRRETWRGVGIRRVWCTSFGRSRSLGRIADYASFLMTAGCVVLLGRRHEVTVCLSTPPLVSVLGLLARARGSRFVYKVEDLYPDVAVALGALSPDSWTTRLLGRLSRFLLARADAVVALDQAMARELATRGAKSPRVLPNWADGKAIYPDERAGAAVRRRLQWPREDLIVLYSGNLGLAHRFDAVIEAARALAQGTLTSPALRFVFVGGGPRLPEVRDLAEQLPNTEFYPYQPRGELQGLYNAASIHLVSLREEVSGMLVPSKYAAALAAGKPVLLVGGQGSDIAQEIRSLGLGWVCDHDPAEIQAVLSKAATDPATLCAAGERAREYFERRYDRRRIFTLWESLLGELL